MLTNELNLPQPFVSAATRDYRYKPDRYSVSDLLGGTCEAILKRRHQGEQDYDVADQIWAVFGTAVHKVLEEAEEGPNQIQEGKLVTRVGNYQVSGIFDLYDADTKTVTDYKTTSVWSVQLGSTDKWRMQTLLYCWILEREGFEARHGEIVAILRDHSIRKAKTEKDYPPHPVYRIGWDFTDKDIKEAGDHVDAWLAELFHEETVEDDYLEPCPPESRWHKPDKWAVMKKGAKRAVRLYESEKEANERAERENGAAEGKKATYYVEYRSGEDTRCQSYCSVAQFCPHGKTLLES